MHTQFTIGNKIGRGPAGACYGGRTPDGAAVVIKVLTRRFAQNTKLMAEVLHDLAGTVGLRHQNLSATLAVTEHEDRDVVLFEPARGVTLQRILQQRGRLDVKQAMRVARDVAMALAHIPERGQAHGDIRPSKVFFDEQHGATLVDLGQHRASCMAAGHGKHGLAFGHPTYLAPEALQESLFVPTPQTDIYALGILFFELVNGRPPFQGDVMQVLHEHLESPLPPPSNSTEITPKLATWMIQMTAKRPSSRFANGKAVVNSLYGLVGQPPPFPDEGAGTLAVMSSGTWTQKATDTQKLAAAKWTESRVMKAPRVGPEGLLEDLYASGLLDREEPEPPPPLDPPPRPEPVADAVTEPEPVDVLIGNKIARGPLGATYEGVLNGYEGKVVIKVITRRFSKHVGLLEEVLKEIRKAVDVEHSMLVNVLHVVRVSGRDMVVMERAEGRTLREVINKEGPQSFSKALNWLKIAGLALQALEKHGLSHGDIRPEKIFVTPQGGARLADPCFAKASCLAANYGQYGMYFGHPDYLAPEVLQDKLEVPNVAADMYSLGIMLYETITGRLPYRGDDARQTLLLHLNEKPPPPPKALTVPRPLAELMLKLMAKSSSIRPQSPKALVDAVTRCQKQVLLTTGLRRIAVVDEFDLADSGDEATGGAWVKEALHKAEKTGTWSRDRIGQDQGQQLDIGSDIMASEELDPRNNPFFRGS